MRHLFADTFYWVALFSPRDRWHRRAIDISRTLGEHHLWTTDEVLTGFLAICSAVGPRLRQPGVNLVRRILTDPSITVLPQTHESFLDGLTLYEQRPDKHYSLTDCISMNVMRRHNLTEVLTHDNHFEQEGFQRLFRERPTGMDSTSGRSLPSPATLSPRSPHRGRSVGARKGRNPL